jgi:Phosphoesterase family
MVGAVRGPIKAPAGLTGPGPDSTLELTRERGGGATFKFDRLGVRVPALLVSPWVRKGRVDHRVYDHTSLLATVKTLSGLPEFLTRRDAQANILDDANFLGTPRPRDDTPSNLTALVPATCRGRLDRESSRTSSNRFSPCAPRWARREPRQSPRGPRRHRPGGIAVW